MPKKEKGLLEISWQRSFKYESGGVYALDVTAVHIVNIGRPQFAAIEAVCRSMSCWILGARRRP